MVLYMVGLGLGDERDITLRGLQAVRSCRTVYLEAYTSLLSSALHVSALEQLYERPVQLVDRVMVEDGAPRMLEEARQADVALLVVGDPFGATTHTDLVVQARKMDVEVQVIHNASVMNAVGACGLQLYQFGQTVSIPFFTDTWRPDSFYDKIKANKSLGLHTLCLLDIRVKELAFEALCRGREEYEAPRYMSVKTAIEQLLEIEDVRKDGAYGSFTTCVGLARLGSPTQKIVVGQMKDLAGVDFGPPLHCLVIVGETHPLEDEMLDFFRLKNAGSG